MADPTTVNSQITDAVTQTDSHNDTTKGNGPSVVAQAPAVALGSLYQAMAQSLSIAMQNAVAAQQQANTIAQATTSSAADLLLSRHGAPDGLTLEDLLGMPYMPMAPDEENN